MKGVPSLLLMLWIFFIVAELSEGRLGRRRNTVARRVIALRRIRPVSIASSRLRLLRTRPRVLRAPQVSSRGKVSSRAVPRGNKQASNRVTNIAAPSRSSNRASNHQRSNKMTSNNIKQTIVIAKTANIMSPVHGSQNNGPSALINRGSGGVQNKSSRKPVPSRPKGGQPSRLQSRRPNPFTGSGQQRTSGSRRGSTRNAGTGFGLGNRGLSLGNGNFGASLGHRMSGPGIGHGNAGSGFGHVNSGSGFGHGNSGSGFGHGNSGSGFGHGNSGSGFGQGQPGSAGLHHGNSGSGFGHGNPGSGLGFGGLSAGIGNGMLLNGLGFGGSGTGTGLGQFELGHGLSAAKSSQTFAGGDAGLGRANSAFFSGTGIGGVGRSQGQTGMLGQSLLNIGGNIDAALLSNLLMASNFDLSSQLGGQSGGHGARNSHDILGSSSGGMGGTAPPIDHVFAMSGAPNNIISAQPSTQSPLVIKSNGGSLKIGLGQSNNGQANLIIDTAAAAMAMGGMEPGEAELK